ncbi:MAG: hypothetical protein ACE5F7_00420 [Nitrospiria bacterium]
MKTLFILVLSLTGFFSSGSFAGVLDKTDAARENLLGPVKNVHVEISKITKVDGKWVEGAPMPWLSTTYNPQGQRIEEVQIYTNPALDFTSIFTRDMRGLLKEGIEYDANRNTAFKWTYSHDATFSHIEENRVQPDGTFFSKTTYDYDTAGNLEEENRYPPHAQNHFKWIYRYDNAGRRIEESHYLVRSGIQPGRTGKSLNSKRVFTYDREGRLSQETRYNGAGEIVSVKKYQYTFDKAGNWISQTALESLKSPGELPLVPTEVTHRKITYHP